MECSAYKIEKELGSRGSFNYRSPSETSRYIDLQIWFAEKERGSNRLRYLRNLADSDRGSLLAKIIAEARTEERLEEIWGMVKLIEGCYAKRALDVNSFNGGPTGVLGVSLEESEERLPSLFQ